MRTTIFEYPVRNIDDATWSQIIGQLAPTHSLERQPMRAYFDDLSALPEFCRIGACGRGHADRRAARDLYAAWLAAAAKGRSITPTVEDHYGHADRPP
jgi:hypothetical protein